jgi:hypothetical protein
VPILEVEVELVMKNLQRWIKAEGRSTKQSIEFGSMIRTGGGPHSKGQAIDINKLAMTASIDATIQILDDLDKTIHSSYGLGFPFQGEFFDPSDELTAKQKSAEKAASASTETANIDHAVEKFAAHTYKSTAKRDKGNWKWSKEIEKPGGAYELLKSQTLKDKIEARRKDGFNFMIFPDNDDHLHLDSL